MIEVLCRARQRGRESLYGLAAFFMDSIKSQDSELLHTMCVEPKSEEQEKGIEWSKPPIKYVFRFHVNKEIEIDRYNGNKGIGRKRLSNLVG